jgi:hypothetical protein
MSGPESNGGRSEPQMTDTKPTQAARSQPFGILRSRPTSPIPTRSPCSVDAGSPSSSSAVSHLPSAALPSVNGRPTSPVPRAASAHASPQQAPPGSGRLLPAADWEASGLPFDDSGFRDRTSEHQPKAAAQDAGDAALQGRATWPPGYRDRLPEAPGLRIVAQQGAVHAAAAWLTGDGPLVYCVGQTGTLKIYSPQSGAQVMRPRRVAACNTLQSIVGLRCPS